MNGMAPLFFIRRERKMNLENLFRWTGELEIKDRYGKPVEVRSKPLVLYQRLIGDADITIARKSALKASRSLRRSLRDQESDTHAALVPDHEDMEINVLQNAIILADALDFRQRAQTEVEKPRKPTDLPDEPTLEERENYLTALEEYDKEVERLVGERFRLFVDTRQEELEKLDRESLVDLFLISIVDSLCRAEMLRIFNSWCAYLGTYSDKAMAKRAFKSYPGFDNAASELKEAIITNYMMLEIGGEDLKN